MYFDACLCGRLRVWPLDPEIPGDKSEHRNPKFDSDTYLDDKVFSDKYRYPDPYRIAKIFPGKYRNVNVYTAIVPVSPCPLCVGRPRARP